MTRAFDQQRRGYNIVTAPKTIPLAQAERKKERKKERRVSHKKGAVSKEQHWNLGQASRQTNKKKKQEETKNKGRERKKKRKGVPGF